MGVTITSGVVAGMAIGMPLSGGTDTRVLFNDGGTVGEDAGLTYNKTTGALTIGGNATLLGEAANTLAQRNGVNAQAFRIYNTFTDAANYERAALRWNANTMELVVDSAGTGAARNFSVFTGGVEVARFQTDGGMTIRHATGGFGYGTGAGGTVTQLTSKATGVTLSKATGEITMNAAALAANTTVSFTLTNTAIAAGDHIIFGVSGGTAGAYNVPNKVGAAGSVVVDVRNVTAASLSEAIVIKFSVFKAVTA